MKKNYCVGIPQPIGTCYFHTLYFSRVDSNFPNPKQPYTCPMPYSIYNGKIKDIIYEENKNVDITSLDLFNLHVLLKATYDILTVDDAIKWSLKNYHDLDQRTIDRVLDMVWESIIKIENINDDIFMDKLVTFYQTYFNNNDYKLIDSTLRSIANKYLGIKFTYHSNKSFQQKIRKLINNYKID